MTGVKSSKTPAELLAEIMVLDWHRYTGLNDREILDEWAKCIVYDLEAKGYRITRK